MDKAAKKKSVRARLIGDKFYFSYGKRDGYSTWSVMEPGGQVVASGTCASYAVASLCAEAVCKVMNNG